MMAKVYSYTILVLIGLFSIAYSVYTRNFAEMHLSLPFLNFPIFVGEILLAVCLLLLLLYCRTEKIALNKWAIWIGIYLAFVIIKAFKGYHDFGPLAFRNAALFITRFLQ
jgi:phosphoglycerol transferase MdoB-like AlkP superfamily enzyme